MLSKRTNGSQPQTAHTAQRELASALAAIGVGISSPSASVLFRQGQRPGGVLVLRKGKVKLSLAGDRVYRVVGPGFILGLPAVFSGHPYSLTAQTLTHCELALVDRKRLLELLERRTDLSLQLVTILAEEVRRMRKHAGKVAADSHPN